MADANLAFTVQTQLIISRNGRSLFIRYVVRYTTERLSVHTPCLEYPRFIF